MHAKVLSRLKKAPDAPGVYFFIGKRKEVLYIGRATSLSRRIQSYFDARIREKRSPLIESMVGESVSIDWVETESVLEAILLEVNLIRTHKPRCNTISKDDKSYNHVAITDEPFPRVLVMRAKDIHKDDGKTRFKRVYGPFPSGRLLRDALKIIQKIFQFYDIKRPLGVRMSKMARGIIDFNRQIGLYPDAMTKDEYCEIIHHLELFFEGKKKKVIRELTAQMHALAKEERFEEASFVKRKILSLTHIQDVALIKDDYRSYRDDRNLRIEAYDIAHLGGTNIVGVMTVFEEGVPNKAEYRKFIIRSIKDANDPAALKEVLERRFEHPEWRFPDIIVVDGNHVQMNVAERIIRERQIFTQVMGVVKDEKHNPKSILGSKKLKDEHSSSILHANAEAHRFALTFHRKRRSIIL